MVIWWLPAFTGGEDPTRTNIGIFARMNSYEKYVATDTNTRHGKGNSWSNEDSVVPDTLLIFDASR